MAIIEAKNIKKEFTKKRFDWRNFSFSTDAKTAVQDLTLSIEEGEFVGFLGPNGAGKTTFLKILSGIIYPTSGSANVLGFTPWERDHKYLKKIALVMGQKNQLWWDLPAIDSYRLLKEVYEIESKKFEKSLSKMVEVLDMQRLLPQRLRDMSLGERMKCELLACFLHDPKVIFLDEPTIGLDVVSAQSIRNFLKQINQEKKCTIILTSHYMADVEALCKRVIVINHGQKIYDGGLAELKSQYIQKKRIEIFLTTVEDKEKFAHLSVDKNLRDGVGIIEVEKEKFGEVAKEVFDKFEIEKITIADPSTEEIIGQLFSENTAVQNREDFAVSSREEAQVQ